MSVMEPLDSWVRAVTSRDARFDGWVIVAVTSTGIYCRPSCPTPVRPKPSNMAFYRTPAAAQVDGYRACKRCTPDAVPGSPEWNRRDDLVGRAIRAIDDGLVDTDGVDGLARQLSVSTRHLNRVLRTEVGASPLALARARRARTAANLIRTTGLAFTDIAFASGFDSVRQFNATIREVFALTPTQLRGSSARSTDEGEWISVAVPYRPPFDSAGLWSWLHAHGVSGVEEVVSPQTVVDTTYTRQFVGATYRRSLDLADGPAVVELVDDPERSVVNARFRLASLSDLPVAINRVRRLLDLDADPRAVNDALSLDPVLAPLVARRPGLRVPGTVCASESVTKTILHQQVSLASAVGSGTRLVADYGTPLEAPVGGVTHLFPSSDQLAVVDPESLALPASRAATIVRLADAIARGELALGPFAERREVARERLLATKGVGPWTAAVIGLRALGDPDVMCPGDAVLRSVAASYGLDGDDAIAKAAQAWSPWRSYAMHHLWAASADLPPSK